jgi:hypothetical protein
MHFHCGVKNFTGMPRVGTLVIGERPLPLFSIRNGEVGSNIAAMQYCD